MSVFSFETILRIIEMIVKVLKAALRAIGYNADKDDDDDDE